MSILMVYVTCEDAQEAEKIAKSLLDRKLIACANILAPHTAVYEWEGKSVTGKESAVILKTEDSRFEAMRSAICEMHSYDCPCIVAWPLMTGHNPFLQWVGAQVGVSAADNAADHQGQTRDA